MPPIFEIAKKKLPVIFVVDTSESINVFEMSVINELMHDCAMLLSEIAEEQADTDVEIGVLEFSSGARWVTHGFRSLKYFYWNDLAAGGFSDLGAALIELESKLNRTDGFLTSETGYFALVIIFVTDGCPSDDWERSLEYVKAKNKWFHIARKIAVAIGDDADIGVLEKLVGSKEAIIRAQDVDLLISHIVRLTVTDSYFS